MGRAIARIACFLSIFVGFGAKPGHSADLIWQVENPFRFFKSTRSFAYQEAAFNAVRGTGPLPADIIWRTERRLNDPDCKDFVLARSLRRDRGKALSAEPARLGGAERSTTIAMRSTASRAAIRPPATANFRGARAKEDYILPDAHTVTIQIAPEQLAGVTGDCVWSWQPRKGGKTETKQLACSKPLTISRVPYSQQAAQSGVSVTVKLPDGRGLPTATSWSRIFSSWRSAIPSRRAKAIRIIRSSSVPRARWSMTRSCLRDDVATLEEGNTRGVEKGGLGMGFGLASSDDQINPKVLPRRLMEDEIAERFNKLGSAAFQAAFDKAGAQWLSRDCHRSQYGYPFRVGIELALENRHRSVSFASFTCSGADVAAGLFLEMDPREGSTEPGGGKVRAQLDQLADLICRGGAAARTQQASYTLPMFSVGSTSISAQKVNKVWCPPAARKRPIDVVLDVGRRQRRRLRRARGLFHDRQRCRFRAGRSPRRQLAALRPAGVARLSRVARRADEGGQGCAAGRLRRRAGAGRAVVLRADPVRRERRHLRRRSDARPRRACQPEAEQAAPAGNRQLPARFPRPARMHCRQRQKLSVRASDGQAAPALRW